MKGGAETISPALIEAIGSRLGRDEAVREELPRGGRIHIDRALPFLCLYRVPEDRGDIGTDQLVRGEASYLTAPGDADYHEGLSALVKVIALKMRERFGAFLLLEIWSQPDATAPKDAGAPKCTIVAPAAGPLTSTIETLTNSLEMLHVHRRGCEIDLHFSEQIAPDRFPALFSREWMEKMQCYGVGVGIRPVYHDAAGETLYPLELRKIHDGMAGALKKTFFTFVRQHSTAAAAHHHVLGRRGVPKAVWEADRALAEIDDAFDFLLQVTPVNTNDAWTAFKENAYRKPPEFYYRPRPFDPALVKRKLFAVRLEKIDDPTLLRLFAEKREELDRKLTMLQERDSTNFLFGSLQTYGAVEADLFHTAQRMLEAMPPKDAQNIGADSDTDTVSAENFAQQAEAEIAYYRRLYPSLKSSVRIRDDIVSGAMVSGGDFLVSKWAHFPKKRVQALLHHEIGTHILTYVNGTAQPFRQLHTGLSGYDEMQEGIAVLSEYLSGGLNTARLRILAGRVIAAKCLTDGVSFVETFATLHEQYGFKPKTAYTITTRTFRGGGLTKDAVYLRGLVDILDYIGGGGAIEPLFVGKIAASHIPLIEELQWREILHTPPLSPRYLQEEAAKERLEGIRAERKSILDIIREIS